MERPRVKKKLKSMNIPAWCADVLERYATAELTTTSSVVSRVLSNVLKDYAPPDEPIPSAVDFSVLGQS